MKNKTVLYSFFGAVGTAAYVCLVALFIYSTQHINSQPPQMAFWGPVFFLLFFVFSAAATGAMVLGRPIMLYLTGDKKEAVRAFVWTLGFILMFILVLGASFLVFWKI